MLLNFDKNNFRKELQKQFLLQHPEVYNRLQKKDWKEMLIFIEGFESCLKMLGEEPMPKADVSEFLKSEATTFLYNKVEEK